MVLSHYHHHRSYPYMMSGERFISALQGVVFASLLAFVLQVLFFSPISSPDLLLIPFPSPPAASSSSSSPASNVIHHPYLPWNNHLQGVIRLGEGLLPHPEAVCVDNIEGVLYTTTRDGWIKRMHIKNESWEDWKFIGGDTLLGITASTTTPGDLLVCDTNRGLLKVNEETGVTILTSEVNGSKIRFADDVVEASDGMIYFSDASTKFGLHDWYLDVLEAKPHGRLLKYDPWTKETSILMDSLCFPNGVALSKDQDFLVVCETWKFRCLKYWLKGEMKGSAEIFIENLPGGPDNINLAPDGSFWIALLKLASNGFEFVHQWKIAKHMVATFPKLVEVMKGVNQRAMVVNVGADDNDDHHIASSGGGAGNKMNVMIIRKKFDDGEGKVMSFVTSAVEFEGHLYLGSLNTNFIGKLHLNSLQED